MNMPVQQCVRFLGYNIDVFEETLPDIARLVASRINDNFQIPKQVS
ncbi:hypothetical protein EC12741_3987 [Escherichia coli 1.2741]|nr:hypothetical protein ECSTEC7V_0605 [Escherichia coli STEC_7v]EIG79356.1 hypothetical protein EC12741_3987 [Escherichia coli 1.2741]